MKKKLIIFLIIFLFPALVYADDIYNINIDAYIDQVGSININESFSAKASKVNKWCKNIPILDNSEISDITIYMDDNMLSNEDYYLTYDDNNYTLCINSQNKNYHEFRLNYTLSNMIFNTIDNDVLYWHILDKTKANNINVTIMGYYDFDDSINIYRFGYKGIANLDSGKIHMSNQKKLENDYVTLVASFPKGTFNIDNEYEKYSNLDDIFNEITKIEVDTRIERNKKMTFYIMGYIGFGLILISIIILSRNISYNKYGYKNDVIINKKEIRESKNIVKNIYYSYTLTKLNNINYYNTNILGAMICKLYNEEKIGIIGNKLDLTLKPKITNEYEKILFDILYEASKDGYLTIPESKEWIQNDYPKLLALSNNIITDNINSLEDTCRIYKRKYPKECKYKKVMDGVIYKDSIKLYGLEKYLNNTLPKDLDKDKIKDYIMYSYLFKNNSKFIKNITIISKEYEIYLDLDKFINKFIKYISNIKEEK